MTGISLSSLFKQCGWPTTGVPDVAVTGLAYDSRRVKPGDLFFAIKGVKSDGHDFLADVAKKGAVAAIVEREARSTIPIFHPAPLFIAMSKIAEEFFGRPSMKIPVIGITGTNGKTTTTYLIEDILRSLGQVCGVLGTINYRLGNDIEPAPNTTPFSIDAQRFLSKAVEKKAATVAMEVSSHALEQHRVDDVRYAVAVFTNLTQDHLDFHKTMENYFDAKAKLFRRPEHPQGVINVDDEYGRRLAKEFSGAIRYGFDSSATLRAVDPVCDLTGLRFTLQFPSGARHSIQTNLLGLHNIFNCLSAAGGLLALGRSESDIVAGLNAPHAVPGRLERVEAGQKFVVVVDYAHTPDALAQALSTLRNTGPRRLLCVFGAGGDRDKTKRPTMGEIATRLADDVFVTSDNPRSEDPIAILKDIEAGIRAAGRSNYKMIEDRGAAIAEAIHAAKEGDVVLIAGKGHETYQIYRDRTDHFSDVETARKVLR